MGSNDNTPQDIRGDKGMTGKPGQPAIPQVGTPGKGKGDK